MSHMVQFHVMITKPAHTTTIAQPISRSWFTRKVEVVVHTIFEPDDNADKLPPSYVRRQTAFHIFDFAMFSDT